ncbi:tigger transposable element-derived protein 1 [Trichonephila clavata]|uniref:Tigger transposable element-derived protein 1 n=1 Tax=Trichonephila clavata TaxID=2740835 RepID=A0A8X6J727_TRICU|nr:tigger transposable element-derived protein 1 [Trichonephila clavata]
MPSRTYISKDEKNAAGFKVAKDRITLLLCSNASGDLVTKPMFIYRSLNPRSMKGCNKTNLPVYWRANKKAWMTKYLFKDWFYNCFDYLTKNYLTKKNMTFKVLILYDNAPSHSLDLSHPNVQIDFLPPNTTSVLQSQDQGIISTFKSYYIRKSFELILEKIDSTENTLSEVWKQFSILNCVEIVGSLLKELVEGDGFDEITINDNQELVIDEVEIDEADLITQISETLKNHNSSEVSSTDEP